MPVATIRDPKCDSDRPGLIFPEGLLHGGPKPGSYACSYSHCQCPPECDTHYSYQDAGTAGMSREGVSLWLGGFPGAIRSRQVAHAEAVLAEDARGVVGPLAALAIGDDLAVAR